MYEISLGALGIIVGIVTGLIGMITGVISLVWLINNNKAKLKLESVYFEKGGFTNQGVYGHEQIGVRIYLKNLGNRPTTIEHILLTTGNLHQEAPFFKEITIPANSSKKFEFNLVFEDEKFTKFFDEKGEIKLGVFISHTFGRLKKGGKTKFQTGYFTIE